MSERRLEATGKVCDEGKGLDSNLLLLVWGKDLTLTGAGEVCFRGLFYEVSLALVGVASPA